MKRKVIIGILVVAIISAIVAANVYKSSFGDGNAVEVSISEIKKKEFKTLVSTSGIVEQTHTEKVYLDDTFTIKDVMVEQFQKVTKGQKIFDIDISGLNLQIEEAKLQLKNQELDYNKILAQGSGNSQQNSISKKLAENNLNDARKNLEYNKKNYEYAQEQYSNMQISKDELVPLKKLWEESENSLKNAQLNYTKVVEDSKKLNTNTGFDIQSQKNNIENTKLKISQLEDRLRKSIEKSISPADGVISEINAKKGALLTNTQLAYEIVNPDMLQIKTKIKETNYKDVKPDQEVIIKADALGRDISLTGKVERVSPIATINKTTTGDETIFDTIVSISPTSDNNSKLLPGVNVKCDIITKNVKDALTVSFEMITEDKDGNKSVYIMDKKDNILHNQKIKTGGISDLDAEVLEGIKEGDLVVTNPGPTIKDGLKAKIKIEQ